MTRQNPDFGPVNAAIQQLGTFQLQVSALGFGKPLIDPVGNREIRTDVNGIIWQWNAASSQWVFIGNSLQPYFGAPVMAFFLNGLTIQSTATEVSIANEGGYHSWPQNNASLLRLPNRFLASNIGKSFNPSQSWSIGNGGNGYFNIPVGVVGLGSSGIPGSTTDRLLAVIMIRRESDGRVDYVISPEDTTLGVPSSSYFTYTTPQVNKQLIIGGVAWRICGVIGQLIWSHSLGRIMYSTQQNKTTYLDERRARVLNLTASLTANVPNVPYARCMFSIFCGNAVGGGSHDIAITNSTNAVNWGVRHVGWFRSRGADMGQNFSYISPVTTTGSHPFAVNINVTQLDVILNGWTQDSVPTIGF